MIANSKLWLNLIPVLQSSWRIDLIEFKLFSDHVDEFTSTFENFIYNEKRRSDLTLDVLN